MIAIKKWITMEEAADMNIDEETRHAINRSGANVIETDETIGEHKIKAETVLNAFENYRMQSRFYRWFVKPYYRLTSRFKK